MKTPAINFSGDRTIWIVTVMLSIISLLVVYSASYSLAFNSKGSSAEYYLFKHAFITLAGLGLMYWVHKIPYRKFATAALYLLFFAILFLVFLMFFSSTSINEAKRWIKIPLLGLTFQPSELAKLAIITYVAREMHRRQAILYSFKEGFIHVLWPVVLVVLLILPSNFSTAALIMFVCFMMFLVGGAHWKHLTLLFLGGILLMGSVIFVGKNFPKVFPRAATWNERIMGRLEQKPEDVAARLADPDDFQQEQARIAIANGGLLGRGPGKSIQRNFLPSAFSDFIFAIFIEEYGLIGGSILLLLYLILLYRGIAIALRSNTIFSSLLAFGITFSILVNAYVNMMVALGIGPVTGQTLPLMSMGGTSLLFTCVMLGMLQSVARGGDAPDTIEAPEEETGETEDLVPNPENPKSEPV
ncbi:MAG: FtsW/RodA/SpoVE family cell cycle protein [Bacteroidales bacterium]